MRNVLIQTYGAIDSKDIRVPIDTSSFVEKKRHWFRRSQIIDFTLSSPTVREFYEYMLVGGYSCYIQETKSGGVLTKRSVVYELVFNK
jgi:hypothetical protein